MKNGHRRMSAYGARESGQKFIEDDFKFCNNNDGTKRMKRYLKRFSRKAAKEIIRKFLNESDD